MAKKIVIANWKMNKTNREALAYVHAFQNPAPAKARVIIAPPYTVLPALSIDENRGPLAAQNVSEHDDGAYTGEVSTRMLKELAVSYCLVGHSERRIYFGETDETVNLKMKKLLTSGIRPVFCFGETQQERKDGNTTSVIRRQLRNGLAGISDPTKILLAYEPVWAISTFQKGRKKESASDEDILKAHKYIRKVITDLYGSKKGGAVKILYGGSVNPSNCKTFINFPEVNGVLVGGASLKVSSFQEIIRQIS